jgi:beta-mannosidase
MLAGAEWSVASTAPNEAATPDDVERMALSWRAAKVPGVVDDENADDRDWWYRCALPRTDARTLRFDGLATLADVFVDGELVLRSENMFVRHRVPLRDAATKLHICFRSLTAALSERRPRPRWKTRLVKHQQLRWFRTTLLGRMASWPAPAPMVGPWRAIELDDTPEFSIRTHLDGTTGVVTVSMEQHASLEIDGVATDISKPIRIDNAKLWWPHTHGTPNLYDWTLRVDDKLIATGRLGFRTVEAFRDGGGFALRVNGVPTFCRGACWTRGDLASLDLLRDAGGNMVRIGGTMVYEDDAFYARCDELGLLVWQDFMFANMDYPADDAHFVASVRTEATQQIARLRAHPSVAVWCGNSEVEQQAAMVGMARESWRNALFGELLPSLCDGDVYVPSTPSEGALPFHTSTGITHYYGVGAYMRPIGDARRANVRFTPECLGFSNVPESGETREAVPRDAGSDWDFADVREHYVRELFDSEDLALSRVATGEVMSQVFSEWRSAGSSCNGALVWYLQDFSPGAGWGIVDSDGKPKACWYALRRVWQPRTVVITDEGLNGLRLHVINETSELLAATLELTLLREGRVVIAQGAASCDLAPRTTRTFESDTLLGAFYDVAYAYRFGPPGHDVSIATLRGADGDVIADAFHFPLRKVPEHASGIVATARRDGDQWLVDIESDQFLYAVRIEGGDDNYFHLPPGRRKSVRVAMAPQFIEAVNAPRTAVTA